MNKIKHIILSAIGIIAITVLIWFLMGSSAKLYGSEFIEKYKTTEGAVLIDVRTPQEYESGHIQESINIDFNNQSFETEIEKLDQTKTYFVYCQSGNRSARAIGIMKKNDIKKIYELKGGIMLNNDIKLVNDENKEEYVVDNSDFLNGQDLISEIEKTELTKQEISGLLLMREEEKLAHDVYVTLGNIWNQKTFTNISTSEQTHTNAVKVLLDRYEIPDPVTDETIGVFANQTLQDLYNNLTAQGQKSLLDAFIVGATIEDLDIKDLEDLKNQTDKKDIITIYNNLQRGSRNHLRAFVKNIEKIGGSYEPQYISSQEYDLIISSL